MLLCVGELGWKPWACSPRTSPRELLWPWASFSKCYLLPRSALLKVWKQQTHSYLWQNIYLLMTWQTNIKKQQYSIRWVCYFRRQKRTCWRATPESFHFIYSEENPLARQTIHLEPPTKPDPMSCPHCPDQRGHHVPWVWMGIHCVWLQTCSLWISLRPPPTGAQPIQGEALLARDPTWGCGFLLLMGWERKGHCHYEYWGSAVWWSSTFRRTGLAAEVPANGSSRTGTGAGG